jgi:anti-sigma B factor antagonist
MYEEICSELTNSFKELKLNCEDKKSFLLIKITGYLDNYNHLGFTKALKKVIEIDNRNKIILDCEKVNYISSAGVGSLMELLKFAQNKNTKLYLMKVNNKNMEVLSLLGFSSFFPIINDTNGIR